MKDLSSTILEIEREGNRLHELLNVGRLSTMTREEFYEVVATIDRLSACIMNFDALHFGRRSETAVGGLDALHR